MTQQKAKTVDVGHLENGPLEERECRDVICCILFIANVAAMVYCSYYAYAFGSISNIFRGTDPNNVICGGAGAGQSYPYLYFTNPMSLDTSQRICVQSCPTAQADKSPTNMNCLVNSVVTTCAYAFTVNSDGTASFSGTQTGVMGYPTTTTIDRVCVPVSSVFNFFDNQTSNGTSSGLSLSLGGGYLSNLIQDITNNWYLLLAGIGAAIIVSFIVMLFLRWCAGCMVWVSILGLLVFLIGLGFILAYSGGLFGDQSISYLGYTVPKIGTSWQYVKYYGYGVWGLAGVFLIVILCLCSRVRLAVAVCKCAGAFILDVCSVMTVPIYMAIVTAALWAVCLLCMVYLVSAASYVATGDIFTNIASYTDPMLARFYFFVFATLWSNALVQAITTFVIASACCMWYFSHGAGEELHLPVLRSFGRAFRYHFGSLAFGAFILALVQFLQFLVEVFKKHAESTGADRNKAMEYLINCLRCCLACVERIVQFINKNAYIQIALSGKNFCMAAKEGFELVWSNPVRYAVVGGIGEVIMFLGKIMIAAGTTGGMYAYLTYGTNTVMGKLLFLLLVFIMAYAVGIVFMIVYSLAMDTLLVCFIVDETNQKAKGGKGTIRAPDELKELIDTNE